MIRPPLDEAVAYARFTKHTSECPICSGSAVTHPPDFERGGFCPIGKELFKAWSEADKYAARLAETDATGYSLQDCADDEYTGRPE